MPRGKIKQAKKPEVLSPAARASIESEREDIQDTLKEAESYGKGTPGEQIDIAGLKNQEKRLTYVLEHGSPVRVRGANKDRIVKEIKEIGAKLTQGMCTQHEMQHPAKNPGAVHKHVAWLKNQKENIKRYRDLQRTLNPEAPESLERLRREK